MPALPNQLDSRQTRNAMRARCNITHKLPTLMFSMAQISLLSIPSTSLRLKAALTFLGSLPLHYRYTLQNCSLSWLAPGSLDHSIGPNA